MKKVAHFIDSDDPGGAETLVIEMGKRLPEYGYRPEVWHFGNRWLEDQCKQHRISSLIVPGHRFYKSVKTLPIFGLIFAKFIREKKVNLLHSHLYGSIIAGSLASFLSGTPNVGTVHDVYTLLERKGRAQGLRMASLLGTQLIAVSEQMKNQMEDMTNFPAKAIQVVSNGVNLKDFSGEKTGNGRKEFGIHPEDLVLISVGRLVGLKGYDHLIKAFSLLNFKKYSLKLVIVGEGPERKKLEEMVLEKDLKGHVLLLGQRNDIPFLLKNSDCFVLSSRSEGLSCSIIEAMAAGLPVVATNVGGNAELVKDGFSGHLVSPEDPVSLAHKLSILLSDKVKRGRFGQASFEIARDHFSIETMMDKYVSLYNNRISN